MYHRDLLLEPQLLLNRPPSTRHTDRWLPATVEGDVLLIANCGAYGYSMASNYNLRPPASEFMIPA